MTADQNLWRSTARQVTFWGVRTIERSRRPAEAMSADPGSGGSDGSDGSADSGGMTAGLSVRGGVGSERQSLSKVSQDGGQRQHQEEGVDAVQ